jgi:AcrR family transcriptional regulator
MSDLATVVDVRDAPSDAGETKGERTRRRILEMAIECFGRRGYRATSVSEIARAANLTQAASYAYFDNKEALFRAAVDADVSDLIDEVATLSAGVPAGDLIPTIIVHAVVALDAHPLTHRVLAGQEPDEVPRLVELPALGRLSDLLADALTDAAARGEVRRDIRPEILASGLESLILGLLFSTVQTGASVAERHQLGVVEAFDLMLRPPV